MLPGFTKGCGRYEVLLRCLYSDERTQRGSKRARVRTECLGLGHGDRVGGGAGGVGNWLAFYGRVVVVVVVVLPLLLVACSGESEDNPVRCNYGGREQVCTHT